LINAKITQAKLRFGEGLGLTLVGLNLFDLKIRAPDCTNVSSHREAKRKKEKKIKHRFLTERCNALRIRYGSYKMHLTGGKCQAGE